MASVKLSNLIETVSNMRRLVIEHTRHLHDIGFDADAKALNAAMTDLSRACDELLDDTLVNGIMSEE